MTQTLQGALQAAIRSALGCANDFNGDLHAMCDVYGIPAAPISGRLIPAANRFDASITDASSALNYFLQNPQNACGTLALDFTRTSTLDPRITFSRGSQATLFDSTGALVYAKHNLFVRSAEFDNASWTKSDGTISANATTAPDGTTSADKFIPNNGISGANVGGQTISFVGGIAYTLSIFAKAAEFTSITVLMTTGGAGFGGGSNAAATFDLSNGTISQVERAGTTASIQDAGNGWYRLLLTATPTLAHNFAPQVVRYNPAGNGVGGVFIWGSQINLTAMEGGVTSSLSTYYPTVASAYYAPRFDYNPSTLAAQGLLIEEQRTNSIRNNTMQGAVAGTPGGSPTNWAISTTNAELATSVIGIGSESGVSYLDVRMSGTMTASRDLDIAMEVANSIAALTGQAWSQSVYLRQVGGSQTNISAIYLQANTYTAGLAYVNSPWFAAKTVTTAALATQRFSESQTLSGATIAFIQPLIKVRTAASGAVDFTLRIGLPQLEQGAFATSVIPTTTTALTRNADVASMTGTNFSSWYNAAAGTLLCNGILEGGTSGTFPYQVSAVGSNANTDLIGITWAAPSNNMRGVIRVSASATMDQSAGVAKVAGNSFRAAIAYELNNGNFALDGSIGANDTSMTLPTVQSLLIGGPAGFQPTASSWIQRISYYPVRLPNSTLQALTA